MPNNCFIMASSTNTREIWRNATKSTSDITKQVAKLLKSGNKSDIPLHTQKAITKVLNGEQPSNNSERIRMFSNETLEYVKKIKSLEKNLDPEVLRVLLRKGYFFLNKVSECIKTFWLNTSLDHLSYIHVQKLFLKLLNICIKPNKLQYCIQDILNSTEMYLSIILQSVTGSGKTFGTEAALINASNSIVVYVPSSPNTMQEFIGATVQSNIAFTMAELDKYGDLKYIPNWETLVHLNEPFPKSIMELETLLKDIQKGTSSTITLSSKQLKRHFKAKKAEKLQKKKKRHRRGKSKITVRNTKPRIILANYQMRKEGLWKLVQDVQTWTDKNGDIVTVFIDDFMASDLDTIESKAIYKTMAYANRVVCMSATTADLSSRTLYMNKMREALERPMYSFKSFSETRGQGMGFYVDNTPWSILQNCFDAVYTSPYVKSTISETVAFEILEHIMGEQEARNYLLTQLTKNLSLDAPRDKVLEYLKKCSKKERDMLLERYQDTTLMDSLPTLREQTIYFDKEPKGRLYEISEKPITKITASNGNEKAWIQSLKSGIEQHRKAVKNMKIQQDKLLNSKGNKGQNTSRSEYVPSQTIQQDFMFPNLHTIFRNNTNVINMLLKSSDGVKDETKCLVLQQTLSLIEKSTPQPWVLSSMPWVTKFVADIDIMGSGVHSTRFRKVNFPTQTAMTYDYNFKDPDVLQKILEDIHKNNSISIAALIQAAGRVGRDGQSGRGIVTGTVEQFTAMFSNKFMIYLKNLFDSASKLHLGELPTKKRKFKKKKRHKKKNTEKVVENVVQNETVVMKHEDEDEEDKSVLNWDDDDFNIAAFNIIKE